MTGILGLIQLGALELGQVQNVLPPATAGGTEIAPPSTETGTGTITPRFTGTAAETAPAGLESGTGAVSSITNVRFTQVVAEVLVEAPGVAVVRVTQVVPEILVEALGTAVVRFTQVAVEVLVEGGSTSTGSEIAPHGLESGTGSVHGGNAGSETAPPGQESGTGHVAATSTTAGGVTQALIEAAVHGEPGAATPGIVVTQATIEWALRPFLNAEISKIGNEIDVTQAAIEWGLHPDNEIQVTQTCIEVAYKPARTEHGGGAGVKARYMRAVINRT